MLICRNRATFFPSLAFAKNAKKRSYLTSFSNATSVPGKRHTATFGSPIAANPRVMEFLNLLLPARLRLSRVGMRRGPNCSHTLKALLSPDMRRSGGHGTLEGVPDNKLDGIPNALGWRLGRSNSAILPRHSRDNKRQWGSRHG